MIGILGGNSKKTPSIFCHFHIGLFYMSYLGLFLATHVGVFGTGDLAG